MSPTTKSGMEYYIALLVSPTANESERIDACHHLGHVRGKEAMMALVDALEDTSFSVRWAAAEALVYHGLSAVEALLYTLTAKQSQFLYEGVHHVLVKVVDPNTRQIVKPVVEALEGVCATVSVPLAANDALLELRRIQA